MDQWKETIIGSTWVLEMNKDKGRFVVTKNDNKYFSATIAIPGDSSYASSVRIVSNSMVSLMEAKNLCEFLARSMR